MKTLFALLYDNEKEGLIDKLIDHIELEVHKTSGYGGNEVELRVKECTKRKKKPSRSSLVR